MRKYKIYISDKVSQNFMNETFGNKWWYSCDKESFFTYVYDNDLQGMMTFLCECGHIIQVEKSL